MLALLLSSAVAFTGDVGCAFDNNCLRENGESPDAICPDTTRTNTPYPSTKLPALNGAATKYLQEVCPHYVGQETCCNDDQVMLMYSNFKTIDSLFGNCAMCSTNLKRFWCEYTCNPHQKHFIKMDGSDPDYPDVDFEVALLTMRIHPDISCDLFQSCKKNPFVATLASG